MTYIVRNEYGAFCSVCQTHLGIEEDDWDCCDTCSGDGIGNGDAMDGDDLTDLDDA